MRTNLLGRVLIIVSFTMYHHCYVPSLVAVAKTMYTATIYINYTIMYHHQLSYIVTIIGYVSSPLRVIIGRCNKHEQTELTLTDYCPIPSTVSL